MAQVTLENVGKVYPNGVQAVQAFDLPVAEGEFMVLVGPSGCGKTTVLRMVAGLEDVTRGTVYIGARRVNDTPPKHRDIAMVFQNYALYPHMTVAENMSFALKVKRVPRRDIERRVQEAASILSLEEVLDRKPGQLSGGQRQRVAMGRAITRDPSVFLMDEPLSNLDAKLRVQLRAEVARLQRRLGVATLYVTHDQTEAMTLGHRVAVVRGGVLQQCAEPQELYDRPRNVFVAAFIGSPAMNLYLAGLEEGATVLRLGSQRLALPESVRTTRPGLSRHAGAAVVVGVRPEDLKTNAVSRAVVEGEVDLVEALGSELLVHFSLDADRLPAERLETSEETLAEVAQLASGGIARIEPRAPVRPGIRARFFVDPDRLHFFDRHSGEAIWD